MAAPMKNVSKIFLQQKSTWRRTLHFLRRSYSKSLTKQRGLVLGVYEADDNQVEFTAAAQGIDAQLNGRLRQTIDRCGGGLGQNKSLVLHDVNEDYSSISLVGLGKRLNNSYDELEERNERTDSIRAAVARAIDVALGSGATGVFTNSNTMWQLIHKAGTKTGDRMWRMPLFKHYSAQVTDCHLADVNNVGKHARSGGSCTAAAFLREFVSNNNWLHLDIAGVMDNKDEVPYLGKGMAGRPTRTVVEFINTVAQS